MPLTSTMKEKMIKGKKNPKKIPKKKPLHIHTQNPPKSQTKPFLTKIHLELMTDNPR